MFRFRRRKKGLRTPDNYSTAQMNADHLATTAIVTSTFGHEPVDEDEQREEAEANLDDVEQAQAEQEADVPDDIAVDSSGGYAESHNVFSDPAPSYDSSPSYDSGSSYSSGDSGGGYSDSGSSYSDGGSY